jgi:hypothetical protein
LYLEDGMYSYGEMSFESHVSVPNIMLGLQDSMISSTSGFLFFIDWKFTTFFNSTIPELSNTYSELEISNDSENESTDNIGLPRLIWCLFIFFDVFILTYSFAVDNKI